MKQNPNRQKTVFRVVATLLALTMTITLAACTSEPEAPPEPEPDTTAPVISGAKNLETTVGTAPSYREGISATDDTDGEIPFSVDISAVDLEIPGHYEVVYTAADAAGNHARVAVNLVVNAVESVPIDQEPEEDIEEPIPEGLNEEMVYELADKVLARILTDDMDLSEQAWTIYNWTARNIKYVGTSDKSSWLIGAYVGFVRGKGDCFNYFAVAKALLARVGIPTVDLTRVPSKTRHYWLLANIGTGWFHFDACPHPTGYPFLSFFATEEQVRAYTQLLIDAGVRENYFVYDYASCMVPVEGTPEGAETAYGWYIAEHGEPVDPNGETTDPADPNAEGTDPNGGTDETTDPGETGTASPDGTETADPENGEIAPNGDGENNGDNPNGQSGSGTDDGGEASETGTEEAGEPAESRTDGGEETDHAA